MISAHYSGRRRGSLVDGPRAGQMETEKASYETGDTLLLPQFASVHQTENLVVKLQNVNQLTDVPSHQINGDGDWNHFKTNIGINQMKKLCEHIPSPPGIPDMSDQQPRITNGERKHALSESASQGFQLLKKPKVSFETNSDDDQEKAELAIWDKKGLADSESNVNCFSELVKSTDFKHDVLVAEQKPENKHCCLPNREIFSLVRNKQVPVSNGAKMTSSNMEDTPGDLLEKTLSQYYPDHVSIAPHNCKPYKNTIERSLAKDTYKHATQAPLLTSGLPISAQMPASAQQNRKPLEGHDNNAYGALVAVNGYSSQSVKENQQQPKPNPYLDIPVSEEPQVLVPEGQIPLTESGDGSQSENGAESFSTHTREQGINRTANQGSYTSATGARSLVRIEGADKFKPSGSTPAGQLLEAEDSQYGHQQGLVQGQYGTQDSESPSTIQSSNQHSPYASSPKLNDATLSSPGGPMPESCLPGTQTQGSETQNARHSNTEADEASQRAETYHGVSWIDLISSAPQHEGCLLCPQQEQGRSTESKGQMPGTRPMQSSGQSGTRQQARQLSAGYSSNLAQDQAESSAAGEWQCTNGDTPCSQQTQSTMQGSKTFMPQDKNISQQHLENPYHSQTKEKYVDEDSQDLNHILSAGLLQQQPPPHPQAEAQPTAEALDAPQTAPSQPQYPGQIQSDNNLMERFELEDHRSLEEQLKSDCKPHSKASQQQIIGITASAGPTPILFDPLMHSMQPQLKDCNPLDFKTDGAKIQEVMKHNHYPQEPLVHQRHQSTESSQLLQLPTPLQPQLQPQLPHGALSQQVPGHMTCLVQPTTEQQDSCVKRTRQEDGQRKAQASFHGNLQGHAALRLHLLQKQEKQGLQLGITNSQPMLRGLKNESGLRAEAPTMQPAQGPETSAMQVPCNKDQKSSIIATMEHQLKQYQPSPLFEKKSLVMRSLGNVKVETSGAVTILSTNADLSMEERRAETVKRSADGTPTKAELSLNSFFESPTKLLDTPIKNLLDTSVKTQYEIPSCHCVDQLSEKDEGPYYTHLGAAPNVAGIREIMEKRFGQVGSCIRIEKVVYTGKEGKSTLGCPIAKWVIRRSGVEEKLLVLVRERAGHSCTTACLVVAILVWEGIPTSLADRLYTELSETLTKHGVLTKRRCAQNEEKTCTCQGPDQNAGGASFSFGCSWSMYYNGCKFARSKAPRKFKLLGDDAKEEEKLEQNLQHLATLMAPTYKKLAPDAYENQVEYEDRALDCRLGLKKGRPFSGVTACLDFCAHAHRDLHNMPSGSTVVCTLTREDNREIGKTPEDEQLHVLPLYTPSPTDEFGSAEAQEAKMKSGAIQALRVFRRQVRMLAEPAKSCRQKKLDSRRVAANKASNLDAVNGKTEKAFQAKLKSNAHESTNQSTSMSGSFTGQAPIEGSQPGHLPHSHDAQHQQPQHLQRPQNSSSPYPSSSNPGDYPRFANPTNSFVSTSQSANTSYSETLGSVSHYPGHVPNTYLNGSNSSKPYTGGSVNPSNFYPGYKCRGSGPTDSYYQSYGTTPKHLDVYRLQIPRLFSQQQYGAPQRYGVNFPPQFSDVSLQVNGYGNCNMRPSINLLDPYQTHSPSGGPESLEAIRKPPSDHPSPDYATASKSSQYGGYPSPHTARNHQMFSPGQDSVRIQNKPEVNLHDPDSTGRPLLPVDSDCPTSTQAEFGLPNGNVSGAQNKQEPEMSTPEPKEKEDVWSDNEHNFLDPEIGGVAVAPSHGSILIECAKRELHATTPLKNPDRNHPSRISLVFYQHKNMNEAKHGLALREAKKAEKAREKEEDAEKHSAEGTPNKSKKVKREQSDAGEQGEPPYKRFIQTLAQKSMSCTTNTYVSTAPYAFSKITGPYNRFI
ncbi:methylcytosine dioxygenase TET2-like [Arapaima gigas]